MSGDIKTNGSEDACIKRPKTYTIEGLTLPDTFFTPQNFREIQEYRPDSDDIFIVTYPKCGTTWMQYIVWEILHDGAPPPELHDMMKHLFPFIELVGTSPLKQSAQRPRTIKTHMPFQFLPYSPEAKYIYVARNPKDCAVSYFHFHREMHSLAFPPDGDFDSFFECFLNGQVGWGDYLDHVLSWYEQRHRDNVLFVTYEEMKEDHEGTILHVAEFLGPEWYAKLRKDEVLLKNIVQLTTFDSMKKLSYIAPTKLEAVKDWEKRFENGDVDAELDSTKFKKVNFFRKGKTGDWRNYFSDEQNRRMNAKMKEKLQHTYMYNLWMKDATNNVQSIHD